MHHCYECRAGEHENYDDDVVMCIVTDPTGDDPDYRTPKRGYLCREHRAMRIEDGYTVREAPHEA